MNKTAFAVLVLIGTCTCIRAQNSSCIPAPDGLVSWWRGEGNALDSVGANNGTIIDGITFTAGKVGNGFVISGTGDDYIRLPQNLFPVPTNGTGNTAFSFELWFKTASGGVILGQQDVEPFSPPAVGSVPALYVGTNGQVYAALFWSGGAQLAAGGNYRDGRFHHVAVTYDGSNEVLYLDGSVSAVSAGFIQQSYATNYWYQLGTGWTDGWTNAPGGWFPFTGVLDEVSYYNRALAPAEVVDIYVAASGGKCPPTTGPALVHRYSFNAAADTTLVTDSVGGANGSLVFASSKFPYTNGAPDASGFTGTGLLRLGGTDGYVQLPSGLVSSRSNVTLEAWITWNGPAGSTWQRILDFGFNDQGTNQSGVGTNYLILCAALGGTGLYGFEETAVNPFGSLQDTNALILSGPAPLPLGVETYLALTYDPLAGAAKLYLNGVLVNSTTGSLNPLSKIMDYNDWLGRSQWARDPFFDGSYDELRIWNGILPAAQIASHYNAGADQPIAIARPVVHLELHSGLPVAWWWTNGTAGFHLESTTSLAVPAWQSVTNREYNFSNRVEVILPSSATGAFYRLKY